MCYDLKTYRCGHYKRTFTNCKCTAHCSGEQRQPTSCPQWFCDKKPYYSDGSCERDHIVNISIGHYFSPETGRRGRYRPGQHLRSLRPPRSSSTTSPRSTLFGLSGSSLPSTLMGHLAIHPDELILDRDPFGSDDIEDSLTEQRAFRIGVSSAANPGEYFASIPRVFGTPQGPQHGLSPTDLFELIAREIGVHDGDIEPVANALEGIIRGIDAETRPSRRPATRRGGVSGRPIRINAPPNLRPFRPAHAAVGNTPSTAAPDLMDLDDEDQFLEELLARTFNGTAGGSAQRNGGNARPGGIYLLKISHQESFP
ncbi:hypothetical protein TWF718_009587 [Orbilia javanica]|uniref:Uncharacterized protein n=1 Tax=Orbilia javanica TaxID=47235 RepID=A0AAN8MKG7_9PEZI